MNFKPTGERVLIERAEVESKTAGGLIIPDTNNKDATTQGKIVSLGADIEESDLFKVGNIAMFTKSYEIVVEGVDYVVVNKDDVLGIFKEQ